MSRPPILVVEDEPAIADTLVYALTTEGFAPEWCATGEAAAAALAGKSFALVVLDVGLPDGSGFELCKAIRQRSSIPVVFLTARNGELDRVLGLEIGGDDYLVKPFSPRELTARVKAVLRRTGAAAPPIPPADAAAGRRMAGGAGAGAVGGLVIDDEGCAVTFHGVPLELTRYEYRLLKTLMAKPGRVFTREQLMSAAWDDPGASLDRTVDAHIKSLRAKLRAVAPETELIRTRRGLGYSLQPPRG